MSTKALVTVIASYYNDEKFLKEYIESILLQEYTNFELILINHATKDSCREIAHSFSDERIINIDMPRNEGGGGGFMIPAFSEVAKGDYFVFLAADDVMLPSCLQSIVDVFYNDAELDMIFSNAQLIDEKSNALPYTLIEYFEHLNPKDTSIDLMKKYYYGISPLPFPGSAIKATSFRSIDCDFTLLMLHDMSLWLKCLIKGMKFFFQDAVLVNYRIHDAQTMSLKNKRVPMYSSFENIYFSKLFFRITDVMTVVKLFQNNPYVQQLQYGDEKFIKFVIAHTFLSGDIFQRRIIGYLTIEELLSDVIMRNEIFERFGFGIKEFRDLYGRTEDPLPLTIYTKQPKQLKIRELAFLLVRKTWVTLTLKGLRAKRKRQKTQKPRYTH